VIALLFAAAVSSSNVQFDLICNVRFQVFYAGTLRINEDQTQHYHVDLNSKRWCEGDCAVVGPFKGADDKTIVFMDSKKGGSRQYVSLDRTTGKISGVLADKARPNGLTVDSRSEWYGTCEAMPFTPMR